MNANLCLSLSSHVPCQQGSIRLEKEHIWQVRVSLGNSHHTTGKACCLLHNISFLCRSCWSGQERGSWEESFLTLHVPDGKPFWVIPQGFYVPLVLVSVAVWHIYCNRIFKCKCVWPFCFEKVGLRRDRCLQSLRKVSRGCLFQQSSKPKEVRRRQSQRQEKQNLFNMLCI